MVLVENKRGSRKGKLYCVGRDIENLELNVVFENHHWLVIDEVEPHKRDTFPLVIHDLIPKQRKIVSLCKQYLSLVSIYYKNKIRNKLYNRPV